METIDNSGYDSEERLELDVKRPTCRKILDSSDEEFSGNAINLVFGHDTNIKEALAFGDAENNKSNIELTSSDEETKSRHKIKKKNWFKKRVLNDSDFSDNNEESDIKDFFNQVLIKETMATTKIEINECNDDASSYSKSQFLDSDIYDAEGSSDEGQIAGSEMEAEKSGDISLKKKKDKKEKTKRNNLPRKSKQTAIEEIHSETQRLIRQSRVLLPYHRPKQRSLSEFLNRRKSLPIVPLKTSSDELSKVWERIEEREKTAESFYKSDSDKSDNEIVTIAVSKVSDNNKPTMDIVINEESSLNFDLHYTETETQGFSEKPEIAIQDGVQSNSEANKELITNEDLKGIEAKKSSELCYHDVNSESANVYVGFLNADEDCNGTEVNLNLIDSNNFGTTLEENMLFPCNQPIKIATSDNISVPSNSSEKMMKDVIYDKGSSENEIEVLIKNTPTENYDCINRSINMLNLDILSNDKLKKAPKLSGQPDEVIDFEKSPQKPGAVKLISRFMKHVTLKPKVKVQENVVVAISEVNENGEIVSLKEETLKIKRKEDILKLSVGDNSKPGETRLKLKATLQHKIAQSREQQFAKRMEEYKLNEEEIYEEKPDYEEECEELIVTESESEDSEIEDDVLIKETIKERNPFVDEEAEESENDEETLENDRGSDTNEYCDLPSVDIGSLLDKDEEPLNFGIGPGNLERNSELMALCSGNFTAQPLDLNELEKNDISISQFASIENSVSQLHLSKLEDEYPGTHEDSDEEITIKKKKKPKLMFSDDEDSDVHVSPQKSNDSKEENQEDLETGDEKDELSPEDEEVVLEEEEENEFIDISKKTAKRFLEAEAELSGSEWGSADEDEIDLDCMEKEEGDEDIINQRKVRSELEKIHMKEMLDEDKREIRALQELFLEDGELHSDGPKRERQFRWYNQDGENENSSFLCNLDGEFKDDEEDEEDESWRKTRLERETFLRNQKIEGLEITDENVKFRKFPKKTIMKPSPNPSVFASPDPRKQFSVTSRRGSFLSRGEKLLSKLAELTNVTSDNPVGGNVRGKRNMVFAVVSPPKDEPKETVLKRKSTSDLYMNTAKKLKFSPPINKSRGSLFEKLKMVD